MYVVGQRIDDKEWHIQGVFDDKQMAEDACRTVDYFVGPLVLNNNLPHEKVDWEGCWYPRHDEAEPVDTEKGCLRHDGIVRPWRCENGSQHSDRCCDTCWNDHPDDRFKMGRKDRETRAKAMEVWKYERNNTLTFRVKGK